MTPLKSHRFSGPSTPSRRDDIRAWERTRLLRFSRIFLGPARAAMGLFLLAAIVLGVQLAPARAQTDTTATYTVKFTGNWTTQSTTVAVPGSAHFTTLIGAVHNSDVTFWAPGGTATAGVELVAEIGGTSTFRTEISNAASGTVKSTVSQSGVGATGSRTFELEFSRTHPLLTLLSMIGPSPDWFVGVSGLSMLDSSNAWRSSLTRDLFAYDAGTEDGESFSLSNPATNPQGTITSLKNMGKFTNVRMARLTFTLKTPPQNNAPEFSAMSTTRSFTETVGGATVQSAGDVGATVTATDDDDDTLTYTLEGTDKDEFTIDSSGQIKTKVGKSYDRETKASYSVTVKADDQNGGTDTITVTINVTDAEEKPLAPAMPSVSAASTTSVNVMWNAPSNTGRPMITSYDLQYKKSSDTDWSDGPQDVTTTSTSIGSLDEDTEYQVQVLASNSDGDGPWSQSGTGRTNMQGNRAPEFSAMSTTRSFTETVGDATVQSAGDVGAAVTATDDDTLTYTLEGTDKDEFTIDSSGQIKTKVGKSYDRETKSSYSVTVKADDQNGGTDTIEVDINVTDAEEKPLAPAMPSVSAASTTSVNVMWDMPSNTGRPMITSYDLQYRQGTSGDWMNGPQNVTSTSSTIINLMEDMEYQVQVLASNSDGDGPWSQPGTGRTSMQGNRAPEFSGTSTTRSFLETVGGATVQSAGNVGAPVTATDDDNDMVAYSLEGTDRNKFTIVSGSGQIRTRVGQRYNRETKSSYSVTVKADDQNGGTDTIAVTINVINRTERPLAPAAPSVFSGSTTSVNVMWNAPSNTGRPRITSYDLQYRQGTSGDWINGPQNVTSTSSTIMNLMEDTEYQVQVRASNADGDSSWSSPGTGRTNVQGNRAPEFLDMIATRSFTETVGSATVQNTGSVGVAVNATDLDNDTLTYTLEGTDKDEFTIDSDGQIKIKVGKSYDRETKASYSTMVRADDGEGGTDTIEVIINVTDAEEKPLAPAMPSVSAASTTSVNVMWNAPSNTGRPMITSYDLQYKKSLDTGWNDGPQGVTTTSTSIGSLDENTEYQVQVRASNSDGDGPWSLPGTGRTEEEAEEVCTVSDVIDDQSLKGFVECAAENIEISDTFEETLRLFDEFRDDKGSWNDGSTYLVLLTRRGGVYFHANHREVEDLDWSGIFSCEGGGSVLDTQEGCFIEYDGASSGYAHPFSASHVPLAHGEDKFVLLGGFDEIPEGEPFTGVIDGPSTEAGEVDTDDELREFVEDARDALKEAVENSEIDPAQLRGILRREGPWREGDVYIYIIDEMGRVIFDGANKTREQKDEYAKQYIRDLIAEADETVVEYTEDGLLRRAYAVRVEISLDAEGDSRVYILGSGYPVEEQSGGIDSGGGGCAVGGNGSGGIFGLFLVALTLLLTVSLKRHLAILP